VLKRIEGPLLSGRLIYRRGDRAFDCEPTPVGGHTSLLVNTTQIEIDHEGCLLFVWGYCPHESWTATKLDPPVGDRSRLRYDDSNLVPGVSIAIGSGWTVSHDASSGWLCVGDHRSRRELVTFAPGAVAALEDGELAALWLRPDEGE
jgi:hypothetical protein